MSGTKEAEAAGGTAMASGSVTLTPEQQQLEDALLEIGRKEDVIQHLQTRAETAERDLEVARGLISRLGDRDALESLDALLRHERARVAELRDAARHDSSAARALRKALEDLCEQVRSGRGIIDTLNARVVLASTPEVLLASTDPTRDMRVFDELPLPTGPRPDAERLAWIMSGMPKVGRSSVDSDVFDELRAEVDALRAVAKVKP